MSEFTIGVTETCKECGSAMVEIEWDIQEMTEGQLADYMAGFSHVFQCRVCKRTDLRDVDV